ncbi:MAG: PilZ domain-containing protein [Polyangia bacterium]
MTTKRFWGPANPDRRSVGRRSVDFYAIEVANGGRYLRRITNLSRTGLLMEDRMNTQQPGAIMELELPRPDAVPVRLKAEVVRVTSGGHVALRALGGKRFHGLGGSVEL